MVKIVLLMSIGFGVFGSILGEGGSCRTKPAAAVNSTGPAQKLSAGVWGGEHVRAEVSAKGVTLEFDCASGVIEQQVVLNSDGKFDVAGKFSPEHGGPVVKDEGESARAARYAGRVTGDRLDLTISDASTKEVFGTFNLVHGNEGRIRKCR